MSSDQTYGGAGDITARLSGGTPPAEGAGRDITAVLIGRAASDAPADPNTAIPINSALTSSNVSTVRAFGQQSQLAEQLQRAIENNATTGLLYGVAPEEVSVTSESIAAGSGVLTNPPIVQSKSDTVIEEVTTDGSGGETRTEVDFNYRYESVPTAPPGDGVAVTLNPITGELEATTDNDYEVSYRHPDYGSAIDAAGNFLATTDATDAAAIVADSMSAGVGEKLQSKLKEIRPRWELALGGITAQPNATNDAGEPIINVDEYSDPYDYDGLLAYPGGPIVPRSDATTDATTPLRTLAGGILGRMASNEVGSSMYNDSIVGYDEYRLTQSFSDAQIGDQRNPSSGTLRAMQLAPITSSSPDGRGEIQIADDRTTSTATDWLRTHNRRVLADTVLLNFRDLAARVEDDAEFQTNSLLEEVKQQGLAIFQELAAAGVILSTNQQNTIGSTSQLTADSPAATTAVDTGTAVADGGQTDGETEEEYYGVEVARVATNALEIQFSYRPVPVTKSVHLEGTVDDQVPEITGSVSAATA